MSLFDGHSHININNSRDNIIELLNNYKLYLKEKGIYKTVISINPFVKENTCYDKHSTKIFPYNGNEIISICQKCGKIIYSGDDYYKKYNDLLLNNCCDDFFNVFLMLSICQTTIQNNIDYFIEKYGKKISGLKLYTAFSSVILDEIKINNKGLPCSIHCSKYNNQIPSTMLNFIKNYNGNIILAHFASLDYNAIEELKQMENVYIDIAPAFQIYEECIKMHKKSCLLDCYGINSVYDLYKRLFECFDIKRIIWGTDYPYSDVNNEINAIKSFSLTKNEFDMVTNQNIRCALKRHS